LKNVCKQVKMYNKDFLKCDVGCKIFFIIKHGWSTSIDELVI